MKLRLGQPVQAVDGRYGEVGDIVVNPQTKSVTHLVIEPRPRHQQARLVPIALVTVDGDTALIDVDLDRLRRFEEVAEFDYLTLSVPLELGPEWDVGTQRLLAPIGYGEAAGIWYISDFTSIAFDRIPRGDCEIRVLSLVRASDGDRVGTVEGFLTADENVTDVVVRAGRRGQHHYVLVPLAYVRRVRSDAIDLDIDGNTFQALPTADGAFRPAGPPSVLGRPEHRASDAAHRLSNSIAQRWGHNGRVPRA